jgi:tryptophanyl-tRNA synthetase
MSTILTGIRANSNLHLGNYLGAVLPMVERQNNLDPTDEMYMMVADLHSFVTPIDHSALYQNILSTVRIFLAAGLDSSQPNLHIFRQSFVPAHSELAWILSCFTYFGEMERMIQFKEKSKRQGQNVNVGLFSYPILMAADIFLYDAKFVPVGEDQMQHLEITRDIAQRINHKFGQTILTLPEPPAKQLEFFMLDKGVRIRSLSNPEVKMSKSITDPKGTILLADQPSEAAKKVMSATTDSLANIAWDWDKQPGITNLLQILSLLSGQSVEQVKATWSGKTSYGDLKKVVASEVEKFLTNFQARLAQVDEQTVDEILQKGEQKANQTAKKTLSRVQKAVGLRKN